MGRSACPGLWSLARNPWRHPDDVRREVDRRLRALVRHAWEHVPLYRERFERAGVRPADIAGQRDLPLLPMIDKPAIVEAGPAALDGRIAAHRMQIMSTSGSSGRVIHTRRTRPEQAVTRRSYLRSLVVVGARPWHRVLTLSSPWMLSRKGAFVKRCVKTRHLFPLDSLDTQIETLQSFQPDGLVGQTGGVFLLARELLRRGMRYPLKFVGPTGATLTGDMAEVMRRAFAADPSDLYGSIELGTLAWQCRRGSYHIDADRIIVEVVDQDGAPVPAGSPGQVVCTSLYAYAMPFIRYRLHDVAVLSTRRCACRCRFPLLEKIEGRINDFIPTPRGDLVSPSFFFHLFDHAQRNPLKEWRLTQQSLGELLLEFVPEDDFDPSLLDIGIEMIQRRFHGEVRVQTRPVEHIAPCPHTGKRRCINSLLRPEDVPVVRPWVGTVPAAIAR